MFLHSSTWAVIDHFLCIKAIKNPNMKSRLSILTQNKFRWVLVAFLLPIFGVVAAFAPTSPGDSRHLKVKTIVQELTLPLQVSSGNVTVLKHGMR